MTARLVIPELPPRGEDEVMSLAFFDSAHRRATALAGQAATLAGVERTIDDTGRAEFVLGQLRASGEPPRLFVSSDRIEWELQMEGSDQ